LPGAQYIRKRKTEKRQKLVNKSAMTALFGAVKRFGGVPMVVGGSGLCAGEMVGGRAAQTVHLKWKSQAGRAGGGPDHR